MRRQVRFFSFGLIAAEAGRVVRIDGNQYVPPSYAAVAVADDFELEVAQWADGQHAKSGAVLFRLSERNAVVDAIDSTNPTLPNVFGNSSPA